MVIMNHAEIDFYSKITPEELGERNLADTLIATHPDMTLEKFAEMIEERIGSWDLPSDDWFTPTIKPHNNEWLVQDFEAIKNGSTFSEITTEWRDRMNEFWSDYASQCVDG